jgi:hypothetical protein
MAEQVLNEIDISIARCKNGYKPYAKHLNELISEREEIANYIKKESERNSAVVTISVPAF